MRRPHELVNGCHGFEAEAAADQPGGIPRECSRVAGDRDHRLYRRGGESCRLVRRTRARRVEHRGGVSPERFGREGRFAGRGGRLERGERFENEEREEHEFFFRHNFFVAFDFGAFGFWPWWWWGWPGWWDGGYPYYGDYYGGYPYYSDPPTNGSQYGADYWNNLAVSVQTKLANQGYYHGQVDGIVGSGTIEAIRRFQADHRLKATGKIDPNLLKSLGINFKAQA